MIEGCITLFIRELKLEKSKSTLYVFSKTNFENETGAAGMVYVCRRFDYNGLGFSVRYG